MGTIGSLLGFYRSTKKGYYWYCLDATGVLQLDYYWGTTRVPQGCTEVLLWYHRGTLRVLLDLGYYISIEWVLLCYYWVTTVVLPWLKKVLLG